jgi:5-methyltetrahydrofolate--homocysteine methyltransferase
MLIGRGLKAGECPDSWNIEKPEILEDIAALYIEAGSDIVSSNTFGGHPLKLEQYGLNDRTEEINKAGIKAIRKAAGDRAYLAASCGTSGKLLKPYGDTEPDDIYEGYLRQIEALASESVDIIYLETMIDLAEAILAVKAARNAAPGIPVSATMTFDRTPRGFFTIMGNTIAQAANELEKAGADIVGSNCGNGIENMLLIAEEFKEHSRLPILIQSNAGLPSVRGETLEYNETPEFMADKIVKMLGLGVNIIGGCCGTTPEHMKLFRNIIDNYKS